MTRNKLIFYYIKNFYKKDFLLVLFLSFFVTILSAPIPFIYKFIVNNLKNFSFIKIYPFVLLYIFLILFIVVLDYIKRRRLYIVQRNIAFIVASDIYKKIFKAPYWIISKFEKGDLIKLASEDANNLFHLITFGILDVLTYSFQLIVDIIIVYILFGPISLFTLLLIPLYFFLVKRGNLNVAKYVTKYTKARTKWFSVTYKPLTYIKDIKSSRIENTVIEKIDKVNKEVMKYGMNYGRSSSFLKGLYGFFDKFVYSLVFFIGIYKITHGTMSLGTLFAVIYVFNSIISNMSVISFTVIENILKLFPSLDRIVNFYSKIPIRENNKEPRVDEDFTIRFEKVKFFYDNSKFLLQADKIILKKGIKYALIGETGAGKTTFLDLILGLYLPKHGNIYINNVDSRYISEKWWSDNVIVLLQESNIIGNTILENIIMDNSTDFLKVEKTIERLGLSDFFQRFKDGLLSKTMDNNKLSGGEKRMLGIVRLLLKKDAPLVLIDEIDTGLDVFLKKKLDKILYENLINRLSITITHDISKVNDFDEIIYIDKGIVKLLKREDFLRIEKYSKFIKNKKRGKYEIIKI